MPAFTVTLFRATINPKGKVRDAEVLETHRIEASDPVAARDVLHADLRQRQSLPEGDLFVHAHQIRD